jgi:hypothetical protein
MADVGLTVTYRIDRRRVADIQVVRSVLFLMIPEGYQLRN